MLVIEPCDAAVGQDDAGRVDAVRRQQFSAALDIGGGKADRASALAAMDDRTAQEMATSEQLGRRDQIAFADDLAHARRARFHRRRLHRTDDARGEAEFAAQLVHHLGVAGPLIAEADAMADDHGAHADPFDEVFANEFARRQLAQLAA